MQASHCVSSARNPSRRECLIEAAAKPDEMTRSVLFGLPSEEEGAVRVGSLSGERFGATWTGPFSKDDEEGEVEPVASASGRDARTTSGIVSSPVIVH